MSDTQNTIFDQGKPHISILSTRNVICSFGGEGVGGRGRGVGSCDVSL